MMLLFQAKVALKANSSKKQITEGKNIRCLRRKRKLALVHISHPTVMWVLSGRNKSHSPFL